VGKDYARTIVYGTEGVNRFSLERGWEGKKREERTFVADSARKSTKSRRPSFGFQGTRRVGATEQRNTYGKRKGGKGTVVMRRRAGSNKR